MSYILSTTSHIKLAQDLSKESNIPLLQTNIDYFSNSEIRTSIEKSVRGKQLFIVTSPHNDDKSVNDYIMETYLLISKGAKDIIVIVTHGILSGPAIDRINNCNSIKELVVSDSLPQDSKLEKCSKLKVFSVVPTLSKIINKLNSGGSLSELFNS